MDEEEAEEMDEEEAEEMDEEEAEEVDEEEAKPESKIRSLPLFTRSSRVEAANFPPTGCLPKPVRTANRVSGGQPPTYSVRKKEKKKGYEVPTAVEFARLQRRS